MQWSHASGPAEDLATKNSVTPRRTSQDNAPELLERRRLLAAHILGNSTIFATIQAAVDAAAAGAIITVDPGVYGERVTINKTLALRGARFGIDARSNVRANPGVESILRGADFGGGVRSASFYIAANNVILDGFTVQDNTLVDVKTGAGVIIAPGVSGTTFINNIVQNNVSGMYLANASSAAPAVIRHNLFRNNNNDGINGGRGIYSDGGISGGNLTNVTIDENFFIGNYGGANTTRLEGAIALESRTANSQSNIRITNNVMDRDGKGVLLYNITNVLIQGNTVINARDQYSAAVRFEGAVSNVTIQSNTLYRNPGPAIRIDNKAIAGDNTGFVITNNNIYGNGFKYNREALVILAGLYDGTLDAQNNWWGDPSGPSGDGPGTGDGIIANGNSVDFSPWASTLVFDPQVPFTGLTSTTNALIEIEDFDQGGEGISLHDLDERNTGGNYRPTLGADISYSADASNNNYISNVRASEWLEYTLNVPQAGTYTFDTRLGSGQITGGVFHLEIDGNDVSGPLVVPFTGSSLTWQIFTKAGITLPAGRHTLHVAFDKGGSGGYIANFDWFRFTSTAPAPTPAAPSNLTAVAAGLTSVVLVWKDNSTLESGFVIERRTAGGAWQFLKSVDRDVTTYTDSTAAAATTYTYRVRATSPAGDSDNSNEAAVTTPTAQSTTFLSDLAWALATNGWGPVERDTSNGSNGAGDGRTITLNGVTYPKGLGAHAVSDITYNLNAAYSTFLSDIGVDDETGPGTVIFQVFADGTKVYDSGVMAQASATKSINLNLSGVQQLRLHVDDAGDGIDYDHADWAGARLLSSPIVVQPPAAPANLAASAISSTRIDLSWSDVANETAFRLERSSDGINFTQIAAPSANVLTFSDTTVAAATRYYYRIRATNSAGDSPFSNVASATTPAVQQSPALIATGAAWKYLDDGSNQGSAWQATSFTDSTWKSGNAQLGYGDGDEATVVGFGNDPNNRFITTYFRKTFTVSNPASVTALALRLLRDDGAVVYLNGVEVYRTNMPSAAVGYNTLASTTGEYPSFFSTSISPSLLISGANVIAVEIHQGAPDSSDISFDLDLTATFAQPAAALASADIGATGVPGISTISDNVYSVTGSGSDIWGRSDSFHFTYQRLDGDGEIVARVAGVQRTNLLSKAGVMLRETLAADSKQAGLFITPANGIRFIRRRDTAGPSTSATPPNNRGFAAPCWLRLARKGNMFSAYRSIDGATWTLIGSSDIVMAEQIYVGLAVTSHGLGARNTASFDHVSIT